MKQILASRIRLPVQPFLILIGVIATLLSIPLRPLWVDEIYQLEATRDQSFSAMLHSSLVAPGGMPFAYLLQKLWLCIAGFSTLEARLPAAFFGLLSVAATAWTASLLEEDASLVAIVSLITPLLFRYATEARPYSQGLFFSALSTALFLRWWQAQRKTTSRQRALIPYSLSLLAGIYSQPFAIFTAIAHGLFVSIQNRKRLLRWSIAAAVPIALYLPWFVLARKALRTEAWPHLMFFSWRQVSPQMILHELSGGGYICSITLLFFAAWGTRRSRNAMLLLVTAIVPAVGAILADAAANYFFAIRQLIFILPPILILAVAGFSRLWSQSRTLAVALACLYVAAALTKDVRWQSDHKENWAAAAAYLRTKGQQSHACISFEPNRDAPSYYFFEKDLRARTCDEIRSRPRLIAISPYANTEKRQASIGARNVGNTLILEER